MPFENVNSLPPLRTLPTIEMPLDLWDWVLRSTILLGLAIIIYASLSGDIFRPLFNGVDSGQWSKVMVRPSLLWIIMGTLFLCFRTVLWFRYRPVAAAEFDEAPSLTVIIPAYNEGPVVGRTIQSVASAEAIWHKTDNRHARKGQNPVYFAMSSVAQR